MFNNLLFLSHGIQIAMFLLLVGLILVFMKMATFEKRLKNMEDHMTQYVTRDDYLETFNNMWDAKENGFNVAPFDAFENSEALEEESLSGLSGLSSISE